MARVLRDGQILILFQHFFIMHHNHFFAQAKLHSRLCDIDHVEALYQFDKYQLSTKRVKMGFWFWLAFSRKRNISTDWIKHRFIIT
jgi:hypothetical protein